MKNIGQVHTKGESSTLYRSYRQLMLSCDRIADKDQKKQIRRAYKYMISVFQDDTADACQSRVNHSSAVASILAREMEMPISCIVAALLQDTLTNEKSFTEIGKFFGDNISGLVSQLHRISELHTEKISIQAENFIQLILTMTDDIRVILIRLADRLNFMRTIDEVPFDIQRKISAETINLYTPLAHRLGLYKIKSELEELAMQHVYPEIYKSIADKIEHSKESQKLYIEEFLKPIERELKSTNLVYEIKSRTKSIPSIWNKMKKQNIEFEQVYDFFAIRIITDSDPANEKRDCWEIYSLVTNIYKPNASRMRDWISAPRSSGYESLHATVIGPQGKWVEVQIRSKRMDEDAEKGQAAHWKYKSVSGSEAGADLRLRNIRTVLENYLAVDSESERNAKIEPFDRNIYIFTPQGDLKKLPAGATALDFAYEVHSDVGNHCTGAKVNNSFVPLKYILKTGDQVEIVTSKNQRPSRDWLNIAITSKALNKIRRNLKEAEFRQADTGRDILLRKLSQLKITNADEAIHKLVTYFKADNSLDLFHDIALERIDIQEIKEALLPAAKPEETKPAEKAVEKKTRKTTESASKAIVIINDDTPLSDVKLARCCHPVMGDAIFGFVTVTEGIKIHRLDCTNAHQMHSRYLYRVVKARWADNTEVSNYLATIKITGNDRVGILSSITTVLSDELKANTRSINIDSRNGRFEGIITIHVSGKSHLEMIIARISKVKDVTRVVRIN